MSLMYIDFENLDINSLKSAYAEDAYFSSVLDFLDTYISQPFFTSKTSGSTGEPKELRIEKDRAEESARLSNQYFGVDHSFHFLLCLDIRFIGSKLMLIRANIAKAKITIQKPSLKFYEEILGRKFDFVSLTPLHVNTLIVQQPLFFDNIGKCLIGSSGVSFSLEQQIHSLNSTTIFYESYAMTETISHFALRNISKKETSFSLLEGFQIQVNSESCLEVFHPIILPEIIVTNDIVEIIDAQHLIYKGRKDNLINSSGIKLNPEYLENEWSSFLPFPFILAGDPEETLGQRLIMILKSPIIRTKKEIWDTLSAQQVPSRMHPKEIYGCLEWVETESLKPKRKEIYLRRIEF